MNDLLFPDLEIGALTEPGRKRRGAPNEDALLVLPAEGKRPVLMVVADGMGGYAGGAQASRVVVEAIADHFRRHWGRSALPDLLGECLLAAHRALNEYVRTRPQMASMGSTAVAAVVLGNRVFVANVGDSRAYRVLPPGGGAKVAAGNGAARRRRGLFDFLGKRGAGSPLLEEPSPLQQLTYDHSVVAEQVRAGLITPLEALRSPKRNRLTQSITPRRPDITPYTAADDFGPEEALLLCTDGLWGVVSEAVIAAVAQELPPQAAAEKLVALTLAHGAPDNVTVVLARPRGAPRPAPEDETNPGL